MTGCSTTIFVRSVFSQDNVSVSCNTPTTEARVGESVDVQIAVSNNNEREASILVETTLGESVAQTTKLLVQGGLSVDFTVALEPPEPGEYEVGVEVVGVSEP